MTRLSDLIQPYRTQHIFKDGVLLPYYGQALLVSSKGLTLTIPTPTPDTIPAMITVTSYMPGIHTLTGVFDSEDDGHKVQSLVFTSSLSSVLLFALNGYWSIVTSSNVIATTPDPDTLQRFSRLHDTMLIL